MGFFVGVVEFWGFFPPKTALGRIREPSGIQLNDNLLDYLFFLVYMGKLCMCFNKYF